MKRVSLFAVILLIVVVIIVVISRQNGDATKQRDKTTTTTVFTETMLAESKTLPKILNMPEQIAGGRPVVITTVGIPPDSQPALLAVWKEQVARFQKLYPNVTIRDQTTLIRRTPSLHLWPAIRCLLFSKFILLTPAG